MIRNNIPDIERKLAEEELRDQPIASRTRAKAHSPLARVNPDPYSTAEHESSEPAPQPQPQPQPQSQYRTMSQSPRDHDRYRPATSQVPVQPQHEREQLERERQREIPSGTGPGTRTETGPEPAYPTTHAQGKTHDKRATGHEAHPMRPGAGTGTRAYGGPGLTPYLMSVASGVRQGIEQVFHKTQDTAEQVKEQAEQGVTPAEHERKVSAAPTQQAHARAPTPTKEGAKQHPAAAEQAKAATYHATEQAKGTGQHAVEQAKATGQYATEQAKGAGQYAAEQAKEAAGTAHHLKEQVLGKTQRVPEQAQHGTEEVKGAAQPMLKQAQHMAEQAVEAVQHMTQQVVAGVEGGLGNITEQVQTAKQEIQQALPAPSNLTARIKQFPTRVRMGVTKTKNTVMSMPSRVGPMIRTALTRISAYARSMPSRFNMAVRQAPSRMKSMMTRDKLSHGFSTLATSPVISKAWIFTNLLLNFVLPCLFLPTMEAKAVLLTWAVSSALQGLLSMLFGSSSSLVSLSTLPYIPLIYYMNDAQHWNIPRHYGQHSVTSSSVQDRYDKVRVHVTEESSDIFNAWMHMNTIANTAILVLSGLSLLGWMMHGMTRLIPSTSAPTGKQEHGTMEQEKKTQ